jgi:hypothetical protein
MPTFEQYDSYVALIFREEDTRSHHSPSSETLLLSLITFFFSIVTEEEYRHQDLRSIKFLVRRFACMATRPPQPACTV